MAIPVKLERSSPEAGTGKPIIFLDIDGVLVTERSMRPPKSRTGFDSLATAALRWLLSETGARIVVSSAWRYSKSLADLKRLFYDRCGISRSCVIDITPDLSAPAGSGLYAAPIRGDEIAAWLEASRHSGPFVIIDDDVDMGVLSHRLIQTRFGDGLTMELARKAAKILRLESMRAEPDIEIGLSRRRRG